MPSASDLVSLVRCPHRVYLDRYGDQSQKLVSSAFLQMLWESGRVHEEDVVAGLRVVPVSVDRSLEERIAETRRLMQAGADMIYHGLLHAGDLIGEPDLLEKTGHPSRLGAFAYVPVEIKQGRAYEDAEGQTPKVHYLAQLCAYAELLEATQGWRPDVGKVIDSDGESQVLALTGFWPTYLEARDRLGESSMDSSGPSQVGRLRAGTARGRPTAGRS